MGDIHNYVPSLTTGPEVVGIPRPPGPGRICRVSNTRVYVYFSPLFWARLLNPYTIILGPAIIYLPVILGPAVNPLLHYIGPSRSSRASSFLAQPLHQIPVDGPIRLCPNTYTPWAHP